MLAGFDVDAVIRALPFLFRDGMAFTLTLTATATLFGLVLGVLIAIVRLSHLPVLPGVAAAYVNLMRALPLVLVIFLFYFLMPYVGQWILHTERPIEVGAVSSSVVTFTLFEAAYFSEIMRAGIQAIPPGQTAAAQALGLRYHHIMAYIVMPQALRNMVPVILTQTIVLFQDTSLCYVLSITDFLGAATKVAHRDGRLPEFYLFAALVYFAISLTASMLVRRLQTKTAVSH